MSDYKDLIRENKLKQILSSCHINFLFGAGVNGDFFPQMRGFTATTKLIETKLPLESSGNLENDLSKLNPLDREDVLNCFITEFNSYYKALDYSKLSYFNMIQMIKTVYLMIDKTENTIDSMSKINVFTFNYDDFIENIIDDQGIFVNVVNPKKLATIKYHNIVTKTIDTSHVVPSFTVSKLHGQVENGTLTRENIILPGSEKFNDVLNKNFFQLLFRMKTELLRENSVLVVIGYSWNDEHANHIVKDCINNGLTVIWFRYKGDEVVPNDLVDSPMIVVDPLGVVQDTTLTFYELIKEVIKT